MSLAILDSSLYSQIVDWSNLLLAYRLAAKGKRGKQSAAGFEHQVADRLIQLQREMTEFSYHPGEYVNFLIHEPKQRRVSAAPFRDRVVHHALCNVIEPIFERQFIADSYANRAGKGTHAAIDRLQFFARRYRYVLRLDIVKHFPSLDHAVLIENLRHSIRDEDVMWLIERIIASGEGVLDDEYQMVYFPGDDLFAINRPRGLPIGNLTSQFWSNVYLTPLDLFVTQQLRCPAYLRYVDDFALFSDSKRQLYEWKQAIIRFLYSLRLTIHEAPAQVIPCRHGIPWLGFVVYPTHRRVKARNVVKFTRKLKDRWSEYCAGKISFAEFDASVKGWVNHVRYADTWGLRNHVFRDGLVFRTPDS
ncbi:MAG: reverse transcriptase domain-containing protein [Blastocatellales bacterium]